MDLTFEKSRDGMNRYLRLLQVVRFIESGRGSDHYESLLAAKQEWILVYHRLNDVLQVWTHLLESSHVAELDR